uniref:Salivary secreted cystatin 1 n=1 Tax=Oncopeltus fasciatus TaxID=7536 RepID=A3FK20_ONCFA|nr:salivary secreted cystatin 1 precursor [Oncopeltus fasciatus]
MATASVLSVLFLVVALATGQLQPTGGASKINPQDSSVREILENAVATRNSQSNEEPLRVVAVHSATSQVVAGTLYAFDYVAEGGWTGNLLNCHSEVLDQPWTNPQPKLVKHKCD